MMLPPTMFAGPIGARSVSCAGIGSLTVTSVAGASPELNTVIVYSMPSPGRRNGPAESLRTDFVLVVRSGRALTAMFVASSSACVVGSSVTSVIGPSAMTLAWLLMTVPSGVPGTTTPSNVSATCVPAGTVPSVQTISVGPTIAVGSGLEMPVRFGSIGSCTTTPVASSVPSLAIVSVYRTVSPGCS